MRLVKRQACRQKVFKVEPEELGERGEKPPAQAVPLELAGLKSVVLALELNDASLRELELRTETLRHLLAA